MKLPEQVTVFAKHLLVFARSGKNVGEIRGELVLGEDRYVFQYEFGLDKMRALRPVVVWEESGMEYKINTTLRAKCNNKHTKPRSVL